jgi:hypothetical protein
LSLLFDIFACSGGDELGYDDLVVAFQVVATSLHRLWVSTAWEQAKWSRLTEALADSAYTKVRAYVLADWSPITNFITVLPFQLEKDLDTSLSKEEFMRWATERFKEDKTVSNAEDLFKLYSSPYLS